MGLKSLTMLGRILDVKNCRKGYLPSNVGKPCFDHTEAISPLERDVPENQGVSSLHIANFLSELYLDETLNVHDIIIVKGGKVITEAYFGAQKKGVCKATFSACKSIVSLAIGMLIDEGRLSLDDKLVDIFKSEMSSVAKLKMRDMNVRHLLTMTSGMTAFEEVSAICEGALFKTFVNTSLSHEPGKQFAYNSTNTYILSAIVKKISGEGLCDYLEPRLFEPLGIKNYYWEKSSEGIELGGWGLYISPEDFAKIGMVVLCGGEWRGKRLISKEYIDLATTPHAQMTGSSYGFDYGFQMWASADADQFVFNGMLGQNVWGFKKNGLLIVNNSGNDELFHQSNYFAIVDKYFKNDLPKKIRKSRKNYKILQKMLSRIAANPASKGCGAKEIRALKGQKLPKECRSLDGLTLVTSDKRAATMSVMPLVWQAVESNYSRGFESLSFEIADKKFYLNYNQTDESYRIPLGFYRPEYTDVYIHNAPYTVGASAGFASNEDGKRVLTIRIDLLETPCSMVLKLMRRGEGFELRQREIPGKPFVYEKVMDIKREFAQKPVVGGVAAFLEDDILEYRIERLFEFDVTLSVKKEEKEE